MKVLEDSSVAVNLREVLQGVDGVLQRYRLAAVNYLPPLDIVNNGIRVLAEMIQLSVRRRV